ncbi:MFS transporter [Halalkalibacter kiskunsagensis]|uniref:MFS transporter n=1 Tax=Halalkalibacter kiskunsagensis TaxID=1548599 RepID=A0ABV6KBI5_9BACI
MQLLSDVKMFFNVKGSTKLVFTLFFYGLALGILAPMNAIYLSDEVGLSKGEVAVVFASSLTLKMIFTVTIGIISDKMRKRKRIPLIATIFCITGLLYYMRATDFTTALIGMSIATAPSGLIMGQLFAMSRIHYLRLVPTMVEMCQLWLRSSLSIGFFSGLLVGANLFLVATFEGVLWGNLVGYVLLLILLLSYKELDEPVTKVRAATGSGEPFSLTMLIALLLLASSDSLRGLYLPLVVNELFGKPELMSYLWSVQAIFELLFMTLAGYWAFKYGSKRIILAGSIFAFIVYITYMSSSSIIIFFIVQPFYSFYVSILLGVAMGYVQRMFINRTGFGSSLYVLIFDMAALIGYFTPLLIQGISQTIFRIPSIFVGIAMILILKELYVDYMKKRYHKSRIFEETV